MGASKWLISLLLLSTLSACAVGNSPTEIKRIALLAPFEGRYREIGYDALYAARLALSDSQASHIELLAVDDGGSVSSATDRLLALQDDPLVTMVISLGYATAKAEKPLNTDAPLPLLIVGYWDAQPVDESTWILASAEIANRIMTEGDIAITDAAMIAESFTCADICALKQFAQLSANFDQTTVVSSALLPQQEFIERYQQSDQFAPPPGLLTTLTYDAMSIAIDASQTQSDRAQIQAYITETTFAGLNGEIRFTDGYWANAPLHEYIYDENGQLQTRDN